MSYISFGFLVFCLLFYTLYFFCEKKYLPYFILIFNILFCASYGLKSLVFLLVSIALTFTTGKRKNRIWIDATIGFNLLVLFFVRISVDFFSAIGLSFYLMQSISYLIDVKNQKYEPEANLFRFAAYFSFFPILLQGPICRYPELKDQIFEKHALKFEKGCWLILDGLFRKLVLSDRCVILVNDVFKNYLHYPGCYLYVAVFLYAIELYCDFSACTLLSRGFCQIMDISLPENFSQPYFSASIKEFWNRWHLSLSRFLRDYIYIPLGGNRKGEIRRYFNILITFIGSALWHGFGITFLIWGIYHAVCQILEDHFQWKDSRIRTFLLVCFGWMLFRAESVRDIFRMILRLFYKPFSYKGLFACGLDKLDYLLLFVAIFLLFMIDWMKYREIRIKKQSYYVSCLFFMLCLFAILIFGEYGAYSLSGFIYMQF